MIVTEFVEVKREEFVNLALEYIQESATDAIEKRGIFHIALSGGESPKPVYQSLKSIRTDWNLWHIWLADERCLPSGDEDLNITLIQNEFLNGLGIPADNIHPVRTEKGPVAAADIYSQEISKAQTFDLILLGIGDDGHTASLFPGHNIDESSEAPDVIPVFDSPKYPTERVSLSLSRINASEKILFLVTGNKKRTIVDSFLENKKMPATLIKGKIRTSLIYCPEC